MDEFELISHYFTPPNSEADIDRGVYAGIGDDCAVLSVPPGYQLVVSTDSLVVGTHFFANSPADDLAWRLLGASVSDLAAMGAIPAWISLAITMPEVDHDWLSLFSSALHDACNEYGIQLIGGDTTRGSLSLTATVHGWVPAGMALMRSGAKVGDLLCVSGTLGDSRGGLYLLEQQTQDDGSAMDNVSSDAQYLLDRFYRPEPRIALGEALIDTATACIDISDGLLGDVEHLLKASKVGVEINADCLPYSAALGRLVGNRQAISWALTGGEDFELCFTINPTNELKLQSIRHETGLPFRVVGTITSDPNDRVVRGIDAEALSGYRHFSQPVNGRPSKE